MLNKQGKNVFTSDIYSCRETCGESMGEAVLVLWSEDDESKARVQQDLCTCNGG